MLRERPYDGEDDIPMSSEFDPISESNVYTFDDLYEKSQVAAIVIAFCHSLQMTYCLTYQETRT